ncbi:MAG: trypsin-like peptidase domain-containing protein [Hyphomicrobiales bacterium]|nr:trypsin-like peptidase domain-containing protein [Hyphomicrobiales bacterium]
MQLPTCCLAVFVSAFLFVAPARSVAPETLQSVVSVLPVWPGQAQGGQGRAPGTAPEGSGVVVAADEDGSAFVATAWHVIKPAERIDVRLADGRILPAELAGQDESSDIALLRVRADLSAFTFAARPRLAQPVCTISNAYGLGLSVSCGVVSALDVSTAGFNPVEDFVQTDAAANPGSSGGALVDQQGNLVGMISAIFAAKSDTNIGINFAVSAPLLRRVVDDLRDDGAIDRVRAGWQLMRLSRAAQSKTSGARVDHLDADGPAAASGVMKDDIIIQIGPRRIQSPEDAIAALALVLRGSGVNVTLLRGERQLQVNLTFGETNRQAQINAPATDDPDCPYLKPVCDTRQAVFPIESFDPLASAVRIGAGMLVTNRHAIGNLSTAIVHTPEGPREGQVIASAYRGDLALLKVDGLPEVSLVLAPGTANDDLETQISGPLFAVGADIGRRQIRVFKPGKLTLAPAKHASLGRLHVTSTMQPGVSGGALVDETGKLIGIVTGGGEGRNEALPARELVKLLELRTSADAGTIQTTLGGALARCAEALDGAESAARGTKLADALLTGILNDCRASENAGQYLRAGRLLGMAGHFKDSIEFNEAAVSQTPNSINSRISLLVSLQLAGRFKDMLPHARWLFEVASDDPQALRFAIQSGVWGGDKAFAESAYQKLLIADPRQAQAARRFIDNAPPAPKAR